MENLKIVIPLKTNSTRVKNKNLRYFFNGDSLFDIKAKQLLKHFDPKSVYVSSENEKVKDLTDKYGFNFHLRDISLTLSTAKENQIISSIVKDIPGNPNIMWVQVTQPLFNEFDKLVNIYKSDEFKEYDSLVVVKKFKHHLIDNKGNPINFNFGYWHKITQDLPNLFEVTWSAFIMKREMLEQAWYQIGRKPYLYETERPLIDIDTESDFELARFLYAHYKK